MFFFSKGQLWSKYGNKSDSMKKVEKNQPTNPGLYSCRHTIKQVVMHPLFWNLWMYWPVRRIFTVCLWSGRPGFNPRSSHTKDSKLVLDAFLLNTQHYKVRIKDKVEQYRERSSALPNALVKWVLKREPSGRPRLRSPTYQTFNLQ